VNTRTKKKRHHAAANAFEAKAPPLLPAPTPAPATGEASAPPQEIAEVTEPTPPVEVGLDQLAAEIKREHEAAEYSVRESLKHARLAGVKLLEVKSRLFHGEFGPWVKTHCGFSHRTANLYMKVAERWKTLGDSQRVANLSLRKASKLLYISPSEEDTDEIGELVNLGLLAWKDLEGLEPLEARTLIKDVRSLYEDACSEPDDALQAKRVAMDSEWNPTWRIDRKSVHWFAARTAQALKDGKIRKAQVRGSLRPLERKSTKKDDNATAANEGAPKERPTATRAVEHVSPLDAYFKNVNQFIGDTCALLTEGHGLLDEHVVLTDKQRVRLLRQIKRVRKALDELEQQATRAAEETESPPTVQAPESPEQGPAPELTLVSA
jgi:hypothetical protein